MRWVILKRSLKQRKNKVLIAIGALVISISLITSLVELHVSIGEKLGKELSSYGANIIIIPLSLKVGSKGVVFGSIKEKEYFLEKEVRKRLSKVSDFIDRYILSLNGEIVVEDKKLKIIGIEGVGRVYKKWVIKGRIPSYLDEVLMGREVMRNKTKIGFLYQGKQIKLNIVGRVETGGSEDKSLIMDLKMAQNIFNLPGRINRILISGKTYKYPISSIINRLKSLFPEAEVKPVYQIAYAEKIMLKKTALLLGLVSIAVSITSFITLISIINAMTLEREKEVGILRALGGTKKLIISLFVLEALIIGSTGGILGYTLGVVEAELISMSIFGSLFQISVFMPLFSMGIGIIITLAATLLSIGSALKVGSIAKAGS